MSYTNINKSSDFFNTKLWTGTGYSNSINMGLQPDWTWIKNRNLSGGSAQYHHLYDSVRGGNLRLISNETNAESATNDRFNGITSTGFNLVGNDSGTNGAGATYVGWGWKANGQGSPNTDGSINTTYTSVNISAGFSISSYTGTGSAGTIGHGLGSTPKMIIVKCRSNNDTWAVYHVDVGATKYLELDTSAAQQTSTQPWNDTEPTSSVFTVGNWSATNGSGRSYIAYCFAEKTGYSSFGKYSGNSNQNGKFIYLGSKPSFIMVKRIDTGNSYDNWIMYDNKRSGYNVDNDRLHADIYDAENTDNTIDIVSNGFKIRSANSNLNGGTHIYMAFGQSMVGSNNIPATAR